MDNKMTLLEFRELATALKGKVTDPADHRDYHAALTNVATYRTLTSVDIDTMVRLREKYLEG